MRIADVWLTGLRFQLSNGDADWDWELKIICGFKPSRDGHLEEWTIMRRHGELDGVPGSGVEAICVE